MHLQGYYFKFGHRKLESGMCMLVLALISIRLVAVGQIKPNSELDRQPAPCLVPTYPYKYLISPSPVPPLVYMSGEMLYTQPYTESRSST